MQTQLKTEEFYNNDRLRLQHDAHIRAYQAQNMGVKVVFCDDRGIPVSDALAPVSSFLPNTSYNL